MQKDTIIYVTDQRQKYLADMLGGENRQIAEIAAGLIMSVLEILCFLHLFQS